MTALKHGCVCFCPSAGWNIGFTGSATHTSGDLVRPVLFTSRDRRKTKARLLLSSGLSLSNIAEELSELLCAPRLSLRPMVGSSLACRSNWCCSCGTRQTQRNPLAAHAEPFSNFET